MSDHPFSDYLRILGKGPKSKRSLTVEEAASALKMILAGDVTDKQLGAFLLLMRANGESQEELIGFVKGLRSALALDQFETEIDLDWAAYAGKWRYPPYFLLSIKLLVENGYKILLHGDAGQFQNREYVEAFLEPLEFKQACSVSEANEFLQQNQAVYLPLECYAPQLREILHLKSELGVRTVFNTAVKLLNPLNSKVSMQGIFHKGVENLHHAAASVNGAERNLVFKGEGGEPEIRPDALTHLFFSNYTNEHATELKDVSFKAITERQTRPKTWQNQDLIDLWHGNKVDVYGEKAVIATTAVALMVMNLVEQSIAIKQATQFWQQRKSVC
ncbi:MAG: glycosyl transferase family protein [Pseudomonadota bacterium]|nr:glycosyl transferase family protein [Pseudomonadota bacterium]